MSPKGKRYGQSNKDENKTNYLLVSQHSCYDSSAWPWERMGVLASVGMGVERGKEGGVGGRVTRNMWK